MLCGFELVDLHELLYIRHVDEPESGSGLRPLFLELSGLPDLVGLANDLNRV